jgi:hypothetical protein
MLGFKNQDSSKAASSGATGAILKSDMSKLMSKLDDTHVILGTKTCQAMKCL